MFRRLSSTYPDHSSSMPTSQERIVKQVLSLIPLHPLTHTTVTAPLAYFTAFTFLRPSQPIRRPLPRGCSRITPVRLHSSFSLRFPRAVFINLSGLIGKRATDDPPRLGLFSASCVTVLWVTLVTYQDAEKLA